MKLEYVKNIIIGGWQLSEGHSDKREGLKVIEAYYDAGFRTFDCADIYTGVEDLIGEFIKTHELNENDIHIHTKYVPDMASLETLSRDQTESIIDRSRARLGLNTLDLVQFHWWHLPTGNYLAALDSLYELKHLGKIREIGLTNFDTLRVQEILDRGIPVASIQSQYSVIDQRAQAKLGPLLAKNAVSLLCYGSVAGGLLSDTWLNKPEPKEPYENRSLVKYMLMVEEMGGWEALQEMLSVLRSVANTKETDIATVTSAYCLSQEAVKACIVGARNTNHIKEHLQLLKGLNLSGDELKLIAATRANFKAIPGDVYELEREVTGKHGRIMKYNLNKR